MTEQKQLNWLEEESQKLTRPTEYEELPSLKLTPNVVAEIDIDISKPFQEWKDKDDKGQVITTKKIIPVTLAGTRLNWWLNVKNPIYKEIIDACKIGQTHFKILQTGTKKDTRYNLVK